MYSSLGPHWQNRHGNAVPGLHFATGPAPPALHRPGHRCFANIAEMTGLATLSAPPPRRFQDRRRGPSGPGAPTASWASGREPRPLQPIWQPTSGRERRQGNRPGPSPAPSRRAHVSRSERAAAACGTGPQTALGLSQSQRFRLTIGVHEPWCATTRPAVPGLPVLRGFGPPPCGQRCRKDEASPRQESHDGPRPHVGLQLRGA